jgi:hypothetical protein
VGFSVHAGWAVAVVLGSRPEVLERARIELAGAEHDSRFVYHAAAEKGRAKERIREATATAFERAWAALAPLVTAHDVTLAALPPAKRELPDLATILAAHPLVHAAEGELYRRALADACTELGLRIVTPRPSPPALPKMGSPWGKDQKDAAALAWAVLGTR